MRIFIFMEAIGVIVILVYALHINAILSCTIETTGTYIKYNTVQSSLGKATYEPVFRYYVKGKEFQGRCLNKMSLSDIQKQFVGGQTYIIYANKKDPGYFVLSRKVPMGNIIGILAGTGIIFITIISLLIWANTGKETKKTIQVAGWDMEYTISDRKLVKEDFEDIEPGSSLSEIEEKFGEPDGWAGSGILWPVYVLEDGSAVELVFGDITLCEDLEAMYLYKGGEEFVLKEK